MQARSAAYIGCSGSMASGMPGLPRVLEQCGDAVAAPAPARRRCPSRPGARLCPPAGRRPPAPGRARRAPGFVERAPVVVARGAPAGGVGGREHAAAAVARQREPGVTHPLRRRREPRRGDLVAPGRDPARMPWRGAGVDDLRQRPLLAHGGGVDRQPARDRVTSWSFSHPESGSERNCGLGDRAAYAFRGAARRPSVARPSSDGRARRAAPPWRLPSGPRGRDCRRTGAG